MNDLTEGKVQKTIGDIKDQLTIKLKAFFIY